MALDHSVAMFDFVVGGVAAVALTYLLYAESVAVHYPRFFRTILLGLLVFAVTGPVVGTLAPAFIHAVHAVAGLVVTIGLYGLLAREIKAGTPFEGSMGVWAALTSAGSVTTEANRYMPAERATNHTFVGRCTR